MKITRRQLRTLIESVLREEKNFDLSKVIDYTVKSGDTLSDLNTNLGAAALGFTVQDQIELNGENFDGDNLSVNQKIKLRVDSSLE